MSYDVTKSRVLQWIGIIAILCLFGGAYWYFQVYGSTVNAPQNDSLTSGLVGLWSFNGDDISGTTAYDRSGSGNNGTLTNGPTKVPGKVGQALNFNGSNQYVSSGTNIELLSAWTISTWVKSTDLSSTGVLVGRGGASNIMREYVFYSASGKFNIQRCDATNCAVVSTTATYSNNTWYHVVGIFDGGTTGTIYVNGVSAGSGTISRTVTSGSRTTYIGALMDGVSGMSYYYPGTLDEARLYNRALSAAEIKSLYDVSQSDKVNSSVSQPQGTGRLDSGLAGYWKLDENTGTSAGDSSTNGNTGTLTNGPTWATGQIGSAVTFDGTDDYVSIPSSSAHNFSSSQNFTVSMWIKVPATQTNTVTTTNEVIQKWDNSAHGYPFVIRLHNQTSGNAGKIVAARYDGTNNPGILSTTTINDNAWHLILFTKQGATLSLYIDGILQGTTTDTTTGTTTNSDVLSFGVRAGVTPVYYLTGSLDEVRIYNRTLSPDEVSQLYRLTTPTGVDTGLKGYWSFNGKDMSGTTAYDRSGAGNTGTLTNGPTKVPGKVGQALNFDGTNDSVNVTDANSLDLTSAVTVSAWVFGRSWANTESNFIVSKNGELSGEYRGYSLEVNTSGQPTFGFNTLGVTGGATADAAISTGRWYFLSATYDRTSIKLYVDGVLVKTQAETDAMVANTYPLSIGRARPTGSAYGEWDGFIDEVRVYNRALSAAEVQSLYDSSQSDKVNSSVSQPQGTGRLDSGLAGYWKLDENTGTSAADSSTNGNTGTLTNGPTWTTGQIGSAVSFDGTNDYATMGNASALGFDRTTPFSFSFWISVRSISSQIILSKQSNSDPYTGYFLAVSSTGQLRVALRNTITTNEIDTSTTDVMFPDSAWRHVVVTYDGSSNASGIKMYVSAVERVQTVAINNLSSSMANSIPFQLSGRNGANVPINASMDDVRAYNRALSPDEVSQLYRLNSPTGTDTGLKGYWSFNGKDLSGTTAYDRSGSGNTGTLTNGPTKVPGKLGQGLRFDGTDDYVSASGSQSVKTLSYWIKPTANANGGIELNANQYIYDNAIPAGWTSPTIYVDGVAKTTSYGSDIVSNGNFASNITGWTGDAPLAWQNAASGDGSTGYLRFSTLSNGNWDRFSGAGTIAASTTYKVSFWYRTSGITGNMQMFFTSNFSTLANASYGPLLPPSANWQYVSIIKTSTSASYPIFGFHKYGNIGVGSFDVDAVSIVPVTTHNLVTDTNWHHVAITTDTAITASAVKLGKGGLRYLSGSLDEVRLYSRALSVDEIKALYNSSR